MPLKTKVGQILLTHSKDENYASLYEETLKKQGKRVELFAVLEITNANKTLSPDLVRAYRKIEQDIVSAFKKVYVSTDLPGEAAFEKALATVNLTLSKLAGKSRVKWFGMTNVVLAAFYDNTLYLSSAGNARAYLTRGGETSQISDDDSGHKINPVKIFSTFTSGKLKPGDRIILTTNQMLNYLSMRRIEGFLGMDRLDDLCEDIIEALQDIKNIGFATFIFEILEAGAQAAQEPETGTPILNSKPRVIAFEKIKSQKTIIFILSVLAGALSRLAVMAWRLIRGLAGIFYHGSKNFSLSSSLQRPNQHRKKAIRVAVALALAGLIVSVAVGAWNRSATRNRADTAAQITAAEKQLDEAEARLIYESGDRVVELAAEAERLVLALQGEVGDEKYRELAGRLGELKQKIEKKVVLSDLPILTQFPNIPTELLWSPNGILGYNKNSGSVAFYDFRTGRTEALLAEQNTGSLLLGGYIGGEFGYVFLNREGKFQTLNVAENTLTDFPGETALDLTERKIQSFAVFGSGSSARIYLLDSSKSEILRAGISESGVGAGEQWLAEEADLTDGIDFAVDGNIYVLFPDRAEGYFRGQKSDFALSQVLPNLRGANKIYATPETQFIYILDPANERILVFGKEGQLLNQLISEKFRELSDIYPDEASGIIYALSGSELLQADLE